MSICAHSDTVLRKSKIMATRIMQLASIATIVLGLVALPAQQAIARPTAAPTPSVNVSITPAAPFIGNTIAINATFSNANDTGYGPYMDVFLPLSGKDGTTGGANDGISFINANYLGATVTTNVLNCPAGSTVTHPLTGLTVNCPAQPAGLFNPFIWQMVVVTMPFGSFVPGQPDATATINAQLSNLADLNVGLPIQVRSGFMFGADPLDNPGSDPVIQSGIVAVTPVPSPNLITLVKTYSGPEDETATGPNYPREYTITATIAPGQTVSSLILTDVLPDNMQFLTMVAPSNATCTLLPNISIPGGTITCPVTQVGNTASMTFRYFIPLDSNVPAPVINASIGDDVFSQNTASATGSWTPIDTRDPLTPVVVDPAGYEHVLTDKSIAIQKGVANITDGINSPNDLLRYTLSFQISDYFAFNDISITDVISDGQHFYNAAGFEPTMSINGNKYSLPSAALDSNYVDVACNYTGVPGAECDTDNPDPNDGTTSIVFEVSPEIIGRSGGDASGRMVGGCVPNTGVGAGNFPDCSSYDDHAATTGTITFYSQILENFTDDYLLHSGDMSVDQGDVLTDSVSIDGALLSVEDASTLTGFREADGSGASVNIPYGVITKSIYAINGSTSLPSPVSMSPGDTVTYRVTYTLPTSDFEALVLEDYLPLPVFSATTMTTFTPSVCGVPASGVSCYGPTDTYHALPNTPAPVIPTLSTSLGSNSVTWTYGDYDADNNQPSRIDLLFTVTVNNQPFADGLFLTNQARVSENSTNAGGQAVDGIIQILLQEPVVNIKKGVVWTDKASASYSPSTTGPVSFNASGCPAFSSTINSTNLAATPINSNLAGVDAGDTVKMAVVLENTGRNAAFDLQVHDALPTGLTFVPGSVCVTDGAGNALTYTGTANNFTSSGITLTSLARGKLTDGTTVATGTNIAIITYNVTVDATAEASHVYTNTATLASYAGVAGGPNHIPAGRTDTATTTIIPMAVIKTIFDTNQTFTSGNNVAIGEIVTYVIGINVPEGTTQNVVLKDTFPTGMAFVDCLFVGAPSGVTTNLSGGFPTACNDPTNPTVVGNGTPVEFALGTITNSNNNSSVEQITVRLSAVILNQGVRGNTRRNAVSLDYISNGATTTLNANAPNVTIVEPSLLVDKTVNPITGDAGDPVTYSVSVRHSTSTPVSNADAFNVHIKDDLGSLPLTLGTISGVIFTGATCGSPVPAYTNGSTTTMVDLTLSTLPVNCVATFTYNATLTSGASAAQTIINTAAVDWSSLPGTISDQSPYNSTLDCERTGNTADCGSTVNNYRIIDFATVTVPVTPTKSLVSTSEAHTSADRLVIGEIARYRLQMVWPEGTTINAMFQDRLPDSIQFLNDGTAKVAFVSDNGVDCSTSPAATITSLTLGTTPWVCGNAANIATITPTFALPDTAVSTLSTTNNDSYSSGTDPYLKFGTLTNSDNDNDAIYGNEYVVVEFNALMLNNINNQGGQTRSNTFVLRTGSSSDIRGGESNSVIITVAEPSLSIAKSIIAPAPTDAGDPITYDIVIANNSVAPNGATAFDLAMSDTLDSNLTNIAATVSATTQTSPCTGGTNFTAPAPTVSGQDVNVNASCLDIGKSITVRITANVTGTAPSSLTIPNAAQVTYTSLPGGTGTLGTSNPTGSSTPGASGTATGERNGSGGASSLNDYTTLASVSTSLANPVSVVKNAPSPVTYTIWQTITYPIVMTLHEGTTQNLRITDTLPQGLEYLSYSVDTTGFTGTVTTSPTVGTVGTAATGSTISTFTFGDTTVTATPSSGTSSFTINVTARVLDVSQNQIGDTKTNSATAIYFDPDGAGSDVTLNGGTQTITIAEPRIVTTKDVLPLTGVDAGDVVTYTVRFANNGTSTAYDVTALDVLAQGVTYNNGSIVCVDNASVAVPVTLSNNTTTLGFDGSPAGTGAWDIPVNDYIQCTYTATAGSGIYLDGNHTNTIDANWTGLDGVDPYERTYTDVVNRTVDGTQDTDDAVFTSPSVTILKAVNPASATIGENLTFTLTINGANGALRNLVLTDSLPAGLVFNNDTVVTGLTGLLAPIVSTPNDGSALVTITWPAADVTKTADSATLVFSARVADVPSNHWASPNMTLTNTFLLDHQTATGVAAPQLSATAIPSIVEPRIETVKSVSPSAGVQAGDTLTYTAVFTNTGSSTAFDVTAHDLLAQGVSYVNASASCLPATVAVTDNGSTLDFDSSSAGSWDIAAGSAITCTYQVTADTDLYLDGNHTNTIDANWSSMNGSVVNERIYNDTVSRIVDGTQDTDDAVFTATGITFSKSVDKSSATIGEVVTYTLTINGPEGLLRNLSITDTLASGWIFNNDTVFTGLSVLPVPTYGTNDGSASVTVTWNFGDVEKSTEPATLTYTVTVANEISTTTGDTLGNAASLTYHRADGSAAGPLTDSTSTNIVEPDLTIVKSIVTPPSNSIGSPVAYSLLLTHTAASTTDAYDVVISDTVPVTYLDFTPTDNAALTVTFTPAACGIAFNNSTPATDTVSISIAHLPMGCQAEVNFTATLKLEITPGLLVTNSTGVGYSTLTGTPAEERSYSDSDSVSFTTSNPDIEKVLDSSNVSQTTDPNLAIGETATFKITVHIPEGTTTTLQVIDTLPSTMAYVASSAVVDTVTDNTNTLIPTPVITDDAVNHRITFDFTGPIVITDADPLNRG